MEEWFDLDWPSWPFQSVLFLSSPFLSTHLFRVSPFPSASVFPSFPLSLSLQPSFPLTSSFSSLPVNIIKCAEKNQVTAIRFQEVTTPQDSFFAERIIYEVTQI